MYSSQRTLSFLPELKRNKFAWDILNQLRRFSVFWKNALTGDICSLNTTFECCFIWRNKQRAGFSSLVRSREVISDVSLTSTPRGLKYTCHDVNKHIIGVMSSSTSSDEEYFSAREFFYRGIFYRGIFLPGNFLRPHKNRAQVHRFQIWDSNIMLLFREVTTHSTRSLSLTHLRVQTRTMDWLLGLITFLLHRLSTVCDVCDVIEINIGKALQLSVDCHQNRFLGMWLGGADISGKFVPFEFG